MDIKYVTPTQAVEVTYEGKRRRFMICHVSAQKPALEGSTADLTADLELMSLKTRSQIWVLGWDTEVTLVDDVRRHADAIPPDRVRIYRLSYITPGLLFLLSHCERKRQNELWFPVPTQMSAA